jgi:hypothetical protein
MVIVDIVLIEMCDANYIYIYFLYSFAIFLFI